MTLRETRNRLQFGAPHAALAMTCVCLWWSVSAAVAQSSEGISSGNPRSQDARALGTQLPKDPDALLHKDQPVYPPIAKAVRVSGIVVMNVVIGGTGAIENPHVISGPPMLQQAALDAVRTWRFKPYLVGGEAVEARATVTVRFNLDADGTASVSSETSVPRPLLSGLPTPPPPTDGKALVYFYRPSEEQQGMPVQVFVNGDLRAELHLAEHVSSEMTPGTVVVSAQTALEGEGQYFPPKLRWPTCLGDPQKPKCKWEAQAQSSGARGCEMVDWRRINDARQDDVALCLAELHATNAALIKWHYQVADSNRKSKELLLGLLLPTAMSGGLLSDALFNNGPEGDNAWLQMCGAERLPRPSSNKAHESLRGSPAVLDDWARCVEEVDEASRLLQPKQRLSIQVERGKNYYIACEAAKLEVVDATTGAYEISELQPIDLIRAAGGGDLSLLKTLLAANTDVNSKLADGTTPLISASQNGQLGAVQLLLGARADLNMKRADGFTALIAASEKGNLEVVQALIRAGSDMNTKPTDRVTALTAASGAGNLGVVGALLEARADVNARRADGFTALIAASENGHLEIVEALLRVNADVNARNANDITALMLASSAGHLDVVRALINAKADVNLKSVNGMTAYNYASLGGHREVMQLLKSAANVVR